MKKIFSVFLSLFVLMCSVFPTQIKAEETYAHSETAFSEGVTLKVEWNDPVLGQPTTFHVSATGGSGQYIFRMDPPSYSNPNEFLYESVADPARKKWMDYTSECSSYDYTFTMMASGIYNFRFYVMDKPGKMYYLRTNTFIQVSDPKYPSVNSIITNAVNQCKSETNGSEYEMALWLHDWLLEQLEYDNSLIWSSAESALTRHTGTCQAYENAYAKLLSAASIENTETRDTDDGHTWNAVKLDGEWYQIDCTWDDSSANYYGFDQRHLYFGLTDELMAIAHSGHKNIYTNSEYNTPSNSLEDNYFVRNGTAEAWAEVYKSEIQEQLNQKNTSFSINAKNTNLPPSIYGIQNGITAYAMNQMNWSIKEGALTLQATSNGAQFDFSVTYPHTEHDWDDGIITKEPTCIETGIKTFTCKTGKEIKAIVLPALGHKYSNNWTIDKQATCKEEGSKSHHCTQCGDKKDVTSIPKTDHNWDAGKVTKEATCTQSGTKVYTCKTCGTTKTETINALSHKYSTDWTIDKQATCKEEGSKSHHCTQCGDKKDVIVISKKNHNWSNWSTTKQATTSSEGKEERKCTSCGKAEERSIPKIVDNGQQMYRLYNPNSGEHFYTADANEKNHLVSLGWNSEGIGWIAPTKSEYPVYRLYNRYGGEHHYTMNKAEKDHLVKLGWNYEGIGWYSADPNDKNSIPLLREYNPNAFANNHNYTTDKNEHKWLVSLGWKDEGKAWYALNR